MKILALGDTVTKKIKCPGCQSILEYDINDIKLQEDPMEEDVIMQCISCPVCSRFLILKGKNMFPEALFQQRKEDRFAF